MIRPDLILTYWILLWYMFYVTGYIPQNPKLAFILGLVGSVVALLTLCFRAKLKTIFIFLIIILVTLAIPLWTLRKTKIKLKDLYVVLGFGLMYIGWLLWEDKLSIVETLYTDLVHDKYSTPATIFLTRLF